MAHKQDRHNCSVMINMKMYLSDLNHWKIQVTNDHVEEGILWTLPQEKRINEVTRDQIIASFSGERPQEAEDDGMIQIMPLGEDKKRCSKYMASMKRRRKMKTYNARNDNKQVEIHTPSSTASCTSNCVEPNKSVVYSYSTYKFVEASSLHGNLHNKCPATKIVPASPRCLSQETIIYAEAP